MKEIDTTLALDNPLHFRHNNLEWISKLIITVKDRIRYGNLQYDINKGAAKISALPSDKTDKYVYPTGEEMLPSDETRMIEKAKFTCSP